MFNKKGSSNTHCSSLQFSLTTLKIFNVLYCEEGLTLISIRIFFKVSKYIEK